MRRFRTEELPLLRLQPVPWRGWRTLYRWPCRRCYEALLILDLAAVVLFHAIGSAYFRDPEVTAPAASTSPEPPPPTTPTPEPWPELLGPLYCSFGSADPRWSQHP